MSGCPPPQNTGTHFSICEGSVSQSPSFLSQWAQSWSGQYLSQARMHLVGIILRGVTASSWARATGKYDREKVWPEQEEAHEHREHWLEKGVEDLEESEEMHHSLNRSHRLPHEGLWQKTFTVLECEPLTILPSCLCETSRGWGPGWEASSEEGYLCSLFCYCFFPRHLSPFGPCAGALNPLCGALILQNFVTVYWTCSEMPAKTTFAR